MIRRLIVRAHLKLLSMRDNARIILDALRGDA
jgi:hypothetical protein